MPKDLLKELNKKVERNARALNRITSPYKNCSRSSLHANGLFGASDHFKSNKAQMNQIKEMLLSKYPIPSYENMFEIYRSLFNAKDYPGSRQYAKFLSYGEPKPTDKFKDFKSLLEDTISHLEIMQEFIKKWVEIFSKEPHQSSAHYSLIESSILSLSMLIQNFSQKLETLFLDSMKVPAGKDLATSLENLANSYNNAYQAINPVLRLIKLIFQRSERAAEVKFLADLSKSPYCTDATRIVAVQLVHDKIAKEKFGSGSRLKNILAFIAFKKHTENNRLSIAKDEVSLESLENLLNTEPNLQMPSELREYYDEQVNLAYSSAIFSF